MRPPSVLFFGSSEFQSLHFPIPFRPTSPRRLPSVLTASANIRVPSHSQRGVSGASTRTTEPEAFSADALWPHLPTMYRLTYIELNGDPPHHYSRMAYVFGKGDSTQTLGPPNTDMPISDNPLPIHSLPIAVNTKGEQAARRLLQKYSQSLRKLHLSLYRTDFRPTPPPPHLCEFSLAPKMAPKWCHGGFYSSAITCLSLDILYKFAAPVPLHLLPDFQHRKPIRRVSNGLFLGDPCAMPGSCTPPPRFLRYLIPTIAAVQYGLPINDPTDLVLPLTKPRKFTL